VGSPGTTMPTTPSASATQASSHVAQRTP
jgi:hypothetical protein